MADIGLGAHVKPPAEKRRIGILTFHCADNFGATLQAYALQEYLRTCGHENEIVDLRPPGLLRPYTLPFPRNATARSVLKYLAAHTLLGRKIARRARGFESFRVAHMRRSGTCFCEPSDLAKAPPSYDLWLVGSDQVWNPVIIRENDLGFTYLLDFLSPSVCRISYASSVVQPIPLEWRSSYREYLGRFCFVSVREASSRDILAPIVEKPIEVCLDPVFLLDVSRWQSLCQAPARKPRCGFILVYDLVKNPTLIQTANRLSRETGLSIISFSPEWPWQRNYRQYSGSFGFEGPAQFLWYFLHADAVVTSSFHGLAYSVVFGKKFIVVTHPTRGGRMKDLCRELEVENALVPAGASGPAIPRTGVELSCGGRERLEALREHSMNYLQRALQVG